MANVIRLKYAIHPPEARERFTVAIQNETFSASVSDGALVFSFANPLPRSEARRAALSFIGSWEGQSILQAGPVKREFVETGIELSDGSSAIFLHIQATVGGPVAEANTRRRYPWLFHRLERAPLAASLIRRFEEYLAGREKLQSAAYYCFTVIKERYGNDENKLSEALAISKQVLTRLRRLSTTVGDATSARKVVPTSEQRPMTTAEVHWLESVLRALISRVGEAELNPVQQFSLLTIGDLPPLQT